MPPALCVDRATDTEPPVHFEVGMMIGCFGVKADGIHEHQRGGPAIGFIRAAQRAALVPPARQRFQLFGDLGIGVGGFLGHGGSPQSNVSR